MLRSINLEQTLSRVIKNNRSFRGVTKINGMAWNVG